ncbi:MAG TPA: hypothetical protein VES97_04860 [Solirubrobacteraceae bacterium]|nr:hypothetical protein [Solirubrobacteraceae bacterium]
MHSYATDLALARLRLAGEDDVPAPVDPKHREDLETLRNVVRAAIELESPCDFADPPNGGQDNRRAFLAHFGELEDALVEWDAEVERARSAPGALWEWYARAAAERGITEPPFAVGSLIDRLATWTVERARNGQLNSPHDLYLQHFKDAFEGEEYVSVYAEGQKVARLPGEPRADVRRRTVAANRLIQTLFDDAQACEAAQEIGRARDSLLDLKHELLDRLALHGTATPVVFAPGCPCCRRQLELSADRRRAPRRRGAGIPV